MKVTQIAELVNGITEQVLGKSAELTAENLKNIVDVGTQLTDSANIDNYVKTLADRIGKVCFMMLGITVRFLKRFPPKCPMQPLMRLGN